MQQDAHNLVHHLALGSPDVEALARFYRDGLGLREVGRHLDERGELRSIWMDLGSSVLMIEKTAAPPRPLVEGVGAGLFLLALRVTPAERTQLEQRLEAMGRRIEARSEFTSYARDPDGNRIAFSHYPDHAEPSSA